MQATKPISIILADDHSIVREGLARLIHHEMALAVCGLFEGSQDVLESVTTFQADMVIVENVVEGQRDAAGISENAIDALAGQTFGQHLRAAHQS